MLRGMLYMQPSVISLWSQAVQHVATGGYLNELKLKLKFSSLALAG